MITYSPLWKMLTNRNMTKTQLRELVGFSTVTLAKLSKDEYVSLQTIDSICKALQVKSITDVVEFIDSNTTMIDDIKNVIDKLMSNKINKTKPDDKDIFLLYLLMEEFITNQMDNETEESKNKFITLYSKCFAEKLLPEDLLDELNKMLKKYMF